MNRIARLMAAAALCCAASLPAAAQATSGNNIYTDLPFTMQPVAEPQIPDYSVSLADFGDLD